LINQSFIFAVSQHLVQYAACSRESQSNMCSTSWKVFELSHLIDGLRWFSVWIFLLVQKLGITKTSPNELMEDEIRRFVRLDVDPNSITWQRG